MSEKRQILITSALPYANGDIHLGHMVEHFLTDMWSRFQKMRGHDCLTICADDTHGTPIMLGARQQGIPPEELIAKAFDSHQNDFKDFGVVYDNYSSTNTSKNQEFINMFFSKVKEQGMISKKSAKQAYCEHDKMFLPDRFVEGTCPKCGATGQRGDSCEKCNANYSPVEMKNAHCVVCGNTPSEKESEHLYFEISQLQDFLEPWIKEHTHPAISNKLGEWFGEKLHDWCISRDEPYFGFKIPGTDNKYFYVWMDAPVGYISSADEWCERNGTNIEKLWNDEKTEIYHNIGKDIVYFHCLFWPAMLKASSWKTPDQIFVHGMLTVDGEKMSKSRGTFIKARTYLDHLDPVYFRYYIACKLNDGVGDIDLNLEDFVSRVNSDLIGKITNVASRGAQMLQKKLDGRIGNLSDEGRALLEKAQTRHTVIAEYYEKRQFSKAMVEIRSIADDANKYFDDYEPWKLIKSDPEKTKEVLTTILHLFRTMAIYLKPVLPSYSEKAEKLFKESPYTWEDLFKTVEGQEMEKFEHILQRIDAKKVEAMVESSKEILSAETPKDQKMTGSPNIEPIADEITIDDFMKVDLRVARIEKAEHVEGAKKLLQLTLDIGEDKRNVFAGIKSAFAPEDLEGRLVVMVANLKPRKMKFGVSEGMVCAAGPGGKDLFLLSPDSGARPGMRIS